MQESSTELYILLFFWIIPFLIFQIWFWFGKREKESVGDYIKVSFAFLVPIFNIFCLVPLSIFSGATKKLENFFKKKI